VITGVQGLTPGVTDWSHDKCEIIMPELIIKIAPVTKMSYIPKA
jgi:hypothetical protein